MATTQPSDAVVVPQSQGTGIDSDTDVISAAAASLLAGYEQGTYVRDGLTFSNVDTTNETVDVASGVCYIVDDSGSTSNSRGSGGNPQIQSTATSGYDVEVPANPVYAVILPSDVTGLGLDSDTTNTVYVSVDVTSQNSVTVHGTSGSAPSNPHVALGTVNTSNGSTTRSSDDPALTTRSIDTAEADIGALTAALDAAGFDITDLGALTKLSLANATTHSIIEFAEGSSIGSAEGGALDYQHTDGVSTSATPIYRMGQTQVQGGIAAVKGTDTTGTTARFTDALVFDGTGGATVLGSAENNSPAARSYSTPFARLDLAMASSTYSITVVAIRAKANQ